MAEYEIEVKHLSKTFEQKGVHVEALSDINLTIEAGDIYGIIGMSGAGKSTLVRCLNYLEKPTDGQVFIEGKDLGTLSEKELRAQRSDIAMIFQHFNLLMQKSVIDNICFPLQIHGVKRKDAKARARELLKTLFASRAKDFITAVDEKSIIIVRELKPEETYEDMEDVAQMMRDMLNSEAMSAVRISYGTIVDEIKQVSKSYKEAKMALDVGKIFYSERSIVAYSTLGIGRLIYQLPIPLCEMFMQEVFGDNIPDALDEETLMTINKFFENDLNLSETSRQLFVHRNTLVYRLEKLQKSTGLDIRVFDDALTFKIALMVVNYMKYMENQDY